MIDNEGGVSKGMVVLLVCSEESFSQIVAGFLLRQGYSITVCPTAKEAMSAALLIQPDVIIISDHLPDMLPGVLLETLHADQLLADTPIIAICDESAKSTLMAHDVPPTLCLQRPVSAQSVAEMLADYQVNEHEMPMVMIVDNSDKIRRTLAVLLKAEGWRVVSCLNGHQALEQLANRYPQLIVLDLTLPEIDGFEFLTYLRKSDSWFPIPVIILAYIPLDI
jgi:CheY-like chemotaxis protein